MNDVAFDSPQRSRFAPCCSGDTRQQFLDLIMSRICDNQSKNILWLYGEPKVGKSALMQRIARDLAVTSQPPNSSSNPILCATLFLSESHDLKRVFVTIAHQLALEYPNYQSYLVELFDDAHRDLVNYTLDEQFEKLFVKPFTRYREKLFGKGGSVMLILFDGLNRSQLDEATRRLVHLVGKFVRQHSGVKWLFASRHHVKDVCPNIQDACELLMVLEDPVIEHCKQEATKMAESFFGERAPRSAESKSTAQGHHPRCYPGTRSDILSAIRDWAADRSRTRGVLWLRGSSGAGKSAIMQTLTEEQSENSRAQIVATIILKGPNSPKYALTTIARYFYLKYPRYQDYVVELFTQKPELVEMSFSEQFRLFIAHPFSVPRVFKDFSGTVLILLDEPEDTEGKRSPEHLISLICRFALENRTVPLRWVITSRYHTQAHAVGLLGIIQENPLDHVFPHLGAETESWGPILAAFSQPDTRESYATMDVAIYLSDVEKYLAGELGQLGVNHGPLLESLRAMGERGLRILAPDSFFLASSIVRILQGCYQHNLQFEPQEVLGLINFVLSHQHGALYFLAKTDVILQALYDTITFAAFNHPLIHVLLAFLRLDNPMDFMMACNYFGIAQDEAYDALQGLRLILDVPPPEEAHERQMKAYDRYFLNYLSCFFQTRRADWAVIGASVWSTQRSVQILKESVNQGTEDPLLLAFIVS